MTIAPANVALEPRGNLETHIVIADEKPVREKLKNIIRKLDNMAVCGEADNLTAAFELIQRVQPDLVITDLDFQLSQTHPFEELKRRSSKTRILVFTSSDELTYARVALRAGASGFVMKTENELEIMLSIWRVATWGVYFSSNVLSAWHAQGFQLKVSWISDRVVRLEAPDSP